jgi:hypothetical protein
VFYIPSWKLSQCHKTKKNKSQKCFFWHCCSREKKNICIQKQSYQTKDDKKASYCPLKLRQIAELYSIYYGIVTVAIIKFTQMQWLSNNNIQRMEHFSTDAKRIVDIIFIVINDHFENIDFCAFYCIVDSV